LEFKSLTSISLRNFRETKQDFSHFFSASTLSLRAAFTMSFIILPVNYDTDLEQIATIDSASSASSAKGLVDVIFPPVRSTKTSEKGLIKSTVSRLSSDGHNSSTKLIKLVDTGLAENAETNPRAIIAYARWRFYTSNTLNEIKYLMREDLPAYFGAGCDPEAVKDCFGTIWQARERLYRRTEYARK
jgi:hypothetical protein